MNILKRSSVLIGFLLMLGCFASHLGAQTAAPEGEAVQVAPPQPDVVVPPPVAQEKILTNYVETGANYRGLTGGFGHWSGGYLRAVATTGRNTWGTEIVGENEFGDSGVYLSAGDTLNFSPSWYGTLVVGSSAGGFFWPRFRADAFLNKKNLARKQWITTLGVGYYESKDVHRDRSVYLGSTYYFVRPWIVEGGVRFNLSNPGAIFSPSGFIAITQGQNKRQYITVRTGFGEEAYQLVGPAATLADFNSQTVTVTWRRWLGKNYGFNLVGDYYRNPYYERGGPNVGLFMEF